MKFRFNILTKHTNKSVISNDTQGRIEYNSASSYLTVLVELFLKIFVVNFCGHKYRSGKISSSTFGAL